MLHSIKLENYRCFNKHEVTFHEMNVIVGANNAGKSTLVEALKLLSLVTNRYRGLTYNNPPKSSDIPRRNIGIMPAMGDIDLRGGSVFHRYGDPPACITAKFNNGCKAQVFVGPKNSIFGVLYDSSGNMIRSKSAAQNVSIPSLAILPQIVPLQENEPRLTREHVMRSMDSRLASRHFRNQMYFFQSEYYDNFVRIAERSWSRLHIESLNVEGDQSNEYLSFHVRDTNFVAEIGWMGHGLQMWLQTMWFLARSPDAATIILDEPDVYMHADLQRRLIRLLKNTPGQKIVATHSVEIMAEVGADEIIIVDKTKTKSSFAASLPAVQNTIDQLGGVHNIHLARLWSSRRCLHVEGKDISILKVFQDILFPNTDLPFDIIPHLSVGGWSGWPQAIGSSRSMKNAAGESIYVYCILDSDYHTEDEIIERYQQACDYGINLHIWTRKEIENYLLIPNAIARLISDGMKGNTDAPLADEVESKIDEIANQLKDDVFDAMSQEYLVRDRAAGVRNANRTARQKIDEAWETSEGRMSVISGKEAISRLSKWSQDTYGISFGAKRLAWNLTKFEIPIELRDIVEAIEHSKEFPSSLHNS